MKAVKKTKTPNTKACVLLLLAVLMSALLLTGCGTKPAEQAAPQEATAAEAETPVEPEAEPTPEPTETPLPNGSEYIVETVGRELVTPYITLYCPEEWEGIVDTEQRTEDGMYKLSFTSYISGKRADLFTLMMGASDTAEGFPLGMLNDPSGTVYIFIAMNEQDSSEWSPEDYSTVCAMQERVNDLIMQFHEDDRFDSGR